MRFLHTVAAPSLARKILLRQTWMLNSMKPFCTCSVPEFNLQSERDSADEVLRYLADDRAVTLKAGVSVRLRRAIMLGLHLFPVLAIGARRCVTSCFLK